MYVSQSDDQKNGFAWTGERYVPFVHGDIELEHLHRYAFARDLAENKDVLDIACGEGYGSFLLAAKARSVIGVDLSNEVIQHAQLKYITPNVQFRQGDCAHIPLGDDTVDIVVSFETIEHHDQHHAMLTEIKRVLRPDGVLVISTPERDLVSKLIQKRNEFHVKELNLSEFTELLAHYFKNNALFSQRVRYGSLIAPMHSEDSGKFTYHMGTPETIFKHLADPTPLFLVALASDSQLSLHGTSFFDGTDFFQQEREFWQRDYDTLVKELVRVKQTISWRITKPLRFFWNTFSRFLIPR